MILSKLLYCFIRWFRIVFALGIMKRSLKKIIQFPWLKESLFEKIFIFSYSILLGCHEREDVNEAWTRSCSCPGLFSLGKFTKNGYLLRFYFKLVSLTKITKRTTTSLLIVTMMVMAIIIITMMVMAIVIITMIMMGIIRSSFLFGWPANGNKAFFAVRIISRFSRSQKCNCREQL